TDKATTPADGNQTTPTDGIPIAPIAGVTDDGQWLKLARSEKIRIPTPETATPVDGNENKEISTPKVGVDTTDKATTP
ncbi:hypothetical protein, partial [Okeania hirsuta]|uniref:hypothetical protein n=1 Tax=Okeania hirsuta TaxID=1458930 RepID=UPI000FBB5A93